MKTFLTFSAIFFAIITTSACKKCQKCEVKDGAAVFGTPTDICGSKKDLDEQRNTCINTSKTFNGTTCECTEY